MQHISESKRKIGKSNRVLWSTDNSNVIMETFTVRREIHLIKAAKMKTEAEATIAQEYVEIDESFPDSVKDILNAENSKLDADKESAILVLEDLEDIL